MPRSSESTKLQINDPTIRFQIYLCQRTTAVFRTDLDLTISFAVRHECSSILDEWTPSFSSDCGCSDPVGDEDEEDAAGGGGDDQGKDGGAVVGAVEPPNVGESKS